MKTKPRIQRDLLIVIGGWEKNGSSNIVEILDINDNKCYISACEINGTIIVAGGSDGRSRLRTAEIYDAHKNQWTKIRRSDAAAYAMSGKMYIAGGYTGETVL
ncbi:Kelch-like protein 10 [Dirofilaria immitis]|nr:Kelch-like protein 10 [Dirofilaria immitis]